MAAPKPTEALRAEQGQSDRDRMLAKIRAKKPLESRFTVARDDELVARVNMLRNEHATRRLRSDDPDSDPSVADAKRRLDEAQAELEETGIQFHLRGIGRPAYESLMAEHPPTEEQKAQGMLYNPETFWPPLLAVVAVEPDLTPEEWDAEIISNDSWGVGEVQLILNAATMVCQGHRIDQGKASG